MSKIIPTARRSASPIGEAAAMAATPGAGTRPWYTRTRHYWGVQYTDAHHAILVGGQWRRLWCHPGGYKLAFTFRGESFEITADAFWSIPLAD